MAMTVKPRIASAADAVKGSRCAPAKAPPLTASAATAQKVIRRLLTQPLRSFTTVRKQSLLHHPRSRRLKQDSTYKLMGIGVQTSVSDRQLRRRDRPWAYRS
jgi:hypothetical protein